jgi:hypothetical protein
MQLISIFFVFEFFEHKGNTTSNLFEYSEIDLKSSIIVVILSKLKRSYPFLRCSTHFLG